METDQYYRWKAEQPPESHFGVSVYFRFITWSPHHGITCTLNPLKRCLFSWFHRETDRDVFRFGFDFVFFRPPTETDRNRPTFRRKTEKPPEAIHFRFTTNPDQLWTRLFCFVKGASSSSVLFPRPSSEDITAQGERQLTTPSTSECDVRGINTPISDT